LWSAQPLWPQLLSQNLLDVILHPQPTRFGPGCQFIGNLDRDFHKKILTRIGATGAPDVASALKAGGRGLIPKNAFGWPLRVLHLRPIPLLLRDERWGLSLVLFLFSSFNFGVGPLSYPLSNFYALGLREQMRPDDAD